ncbi:hypothetical protein HYW75_02350 [Candidatus Pacearchaeota archaeon]|nr:hypothetical protein [Candidatus Pacearchaeota archaeon]
MMKGLLLPDKKYKRKRAVSEIVSYTLLIIIAIGVSSLVYYFLMLQTPKEKTECKEGISLGIDYIKCGINNNERIITLSLLNNGRFKVDAAYIRVGEEGKSVRYWLNDPDKDDNGKSVSDPKDKREDKFYLSSSDSSTNAGLSPGKLSLPREHKIFASIPDSSNYILEIEPAIISETTGKLAACETAVITQKITCS